MRKSKKILSILTAALVMVTMTSAFSFAEEIDGVAGQDQTQTEEAATLDDATDATEASDSEGGLATQDTPAVQAEAGNGQVLLTWTNVEGAEVGKYTFKANGEDITPVALIGETETTATVTGLNNLTAYTFSVFYDGTQIGGDVTATPVAKVKVSTLSGNRMIKIKWDDVNGVANNSTAYEYVIQRMGNDESSYTTIENPTITYENGVASYIDKDMGRYIDSKKKSMYKTYKYIVSVKAVSGDAIEATTSDAVSDSPVRGAFVQVKTKTKKSLTSHDGKKKTVTFAKGATIQTYGFSGGKYDIYYNPTTKTFADKNVDVNDPNFSTSGYYYFRLARINAKSQSTEYVKKGGWNYSVEEAEFYMDYVKGSYGESKTNYLIWVNEYTQHLYLYKKASDGTWNVWKDWEVSTGKASTPSPTALKKSITKKVSKRHGIKWWSLYSSWNGLHGVKSNWASKLGSVQSSGCIRNSVSNAKILYTYAKKGTRVRVY